jgi:hypothetical protein
MQDAYVPGGERGTIQRHVHRVRATGQLALHVAGAFYECQPELERSKCAAQFVQWAVERLQPVTKASDPPSKLSAQQGEGRGCSAQRK